MKITYLGHSCIYIETAGSKLIVDPFISGNELASTVAIDEIEVDYILLTHGHQDHVLDAERIAKNNKDATIISNFEIANWYEAKGCSAIGMNLGGQLNFPFGTLKYVVAIHSSTLPDGTPGGNPGGFVLYNDEACIYIAGDTALTIDMQLIPQLCPKVNLAILPVGDFFTMGYKDACIASDFVECDHVLGCHLDSFPPIEIDHSEAIDYFETKGKKLSLLRVTETLEVWK